MSRRDTDPRRPSHSRRSSHHHPSGTEVSGQYSYGPENSEPDQSIPLRIQPQAQQKQQRDALLPYEQRLYRFAKEHEERPFALSFRRLHRLNIVRLQNDLARLRCHLSEDVSLSAERADEMRLLLREYVTAVRDYEYMCTHEEYADKPSRSLMRSLRESFPEIADHAANPFEGNYLQLCQGRACSCGGGGGSSSSSGGSGGGGGGIVGGGGGGGKDEYDPLRDVLRRHLPVFLTWSQAEKKARRSEYIASECPQQVSAVVDALARFIVAVIGGGALLVPMIIMLVNPSQIKSIVTVAVAVTLFAGAVSLLFRASNAGTLTATAAYAAVLVVFVGTNGN